MIMNSKKILFITLLCIVQTSFDMQQYYIPYPQQAPSGPVYYLPQQQLFYQPATQQRQVIFPSVAQPRPAQTPSIIQSKQAQPKPLDLRLKPKNAAIADEHKPKDNPLQSLPILEPTQHLYPDIDVKDKYGNTALHRAGINGNVSAVRKLLDRGASVERMNCDNVTPLMLAADDPEIVKLLLERKADVNAQSCMGLTVLRYVNNCKSLSLLLSANADPNIPDNYGRTPVHDAVISNTKKLQLLLEAKANPNAQDRPGQTPLHIATTHTYCPYAIPLSSNAISLLIAAKANPNLRDGGGNTPLQYAKQGGKIYFDKNWEERGNEMIQLLLAGGAKPLPQLNADIKSRWIGDCK